ncbi:MAG: hypothetical protein ACRESY_12090, partial [Steroidobacteraceae bacterium]
MTAASFDDASLDEACLEVASFDAGSLVLALLPAETSLRAPPIELGDALAAAAGGISDGRVLGCAAAGPALGADGTGADVAGAAAGLRCPAEGTRIAHHTQAASTKTMAPISAARGGSDTPPAGPVPG